MSRKLATLLDRPETVVSAVVKRLEHVCGFPSADVSLLADVNLSVRSKVTSLSLDPDDTTAQELHHALIGRYKQDEKMLASRIGLTSNGIDNHQFVLKVLDFIDHADLPNDVWALKRTAAKDILRSNPPRQLMKRLNYRSVDSMLKRESVNELCAASAFTESERWLKNYWKALSKTQPTDFETRTVETTILDSRYLGLRKNQEMSAVSNVPYLGSIVIWSSDSAARLGVIGLGLAILDSINNLKVYSAFAKLHQVEASFGNHIVEMLRGGIKAPLELVKVPISWASLFHHFGKLASDEFSEMFGPHLAHEDIQLINPLKALVPLSPSLKWWSELEHVGAELKGRVISFNIKDVIDNHLSERNYSRSNTTHLENSLWHELIGRYLSHPGAQSLVLARASESQWQPKTVQQNNPSSVELEINDREFAGIA